ncbi:two-component system response regulator KdpE [Pseudomonas sp. FW306-02-F02-AA]|uniref:Fis family transcriptional regulator n=1 Tax=Pseudomonas fluorescens TaxID=294 RepID=A0A0N9W192_PSEFL|nr:MULTISPECIES: two-component system response regulator KdpE [Pseudomonas]ALI04885.1 Fis family transcriptional regulator [Pseudomonas fluorescens]PMZ05607.1 two-component system response regulator KdpE [Pseudomonas sp. FW306-02-F02-AB]PMZ11176.1 two-component system response regulator KdpE [Pseudomonas sp. FW306-02-H06C]PMZ17131.1 two-component system response regulator KdpE [Pseudomonas sp. FW306-02-F02-AA]PMZ23377.1 two-component system response regulator KdpE [Pseudomonas sp. FW306-02-F08
MSEPVLRVLLIEDEKDIRRFVRMALQADGLEVHEAETFQRGLIDAGTRRPDLIVLDLGLPDGDGVDLIRDLRTWSEVPIIVLSARGAESDKILALDTGADDYLVKPFGTGELLARVRALLRRRVKDTENRSVLAFSDIQIDLDRRVVERAGVPLHLTPLEYRLLVHLCSHPDRVLTHLQLLKAVWGPSHTNDTPYLRVFMGGLRKKIEADPSQPRHLVTETGVGYRFIP